MKSLPVYLVCAFIGVLLWSMYQLFPWTMLGVTVAVWLFIAWVGTSGIQAPPRRGLT